jgi:hypothetical protein
MYRLGPIHKRPIPPLHSVKSSFKANPAEPHTATSKIRRKLHTLSTDVAPVLDPGMREYYMARIGEIAHILQNKVPSRNPRLHRRRLRCNYKSDCATQPPHALELPASMFRKCAVCYRLRYLFNGRLCLSMIAAQTAMTNSLEVGFNKNIDAGEGSNSRSTNDAMPSSRDLKVKVVGNRSLHRIDQYLY